MPAGECINGRRSYGRHSAGSDDPTSPAAAAAAAAAMCCGYGTDGWCVRCCISFYCCVCMNDVHYVSITLLLVFEVFAC